MSPAKRGLLGLGLLGLGLAGFMEACMRFSVEHGGWQRFANPGAYFDPTCEDHFWRMLHHSPGWDWPTKNWPGWKDGAPLHTPHELDPQLGWSVDARNKNEWGAWESPRYPLRFTGDPLGVFGDSYVFSTTADGDRLPDRLASLLPEERVLNYGVAGYGFDQIVLAFEAQAERLSGNRALIGLLTTDLDRSVLSVRSGPKPFFTEENGALSLHTDHITDNKIYFEEHPVRPLSYLWTYLRINIPRHWNVWIRKTPWSCEVDQKERINRALFTRLAEQCEAHSIDCTVVLFHNPEHVGLEPGWRSDLVHQEAQRVGLDLVDTRSAVLTAQAEGKQVYGSDRHPNPVGNRVLAKAIVAELEKFQDPHQSQAGEGQDHEEVAE